jgi:ubiquinone/menaquinone biosynthesis C-methylase UbiE
MKKSHPEAEYYSGDDIMQMSYTDVVSLLQEENRPSGGKRSVREIVLNSFITSTSRVLEVGSTNGFSSLEVARTVGCSVIGIDINPYSVAYAQKRAESECLSDKVQFQIASASDIPFGDNSFNLVITGNATSFMDKQQKAVSEYIRVVKPNGFIAVVPIWYKSEPPQDIIERTSEIIGTQITPRSRTDWHDFFKDSALVELYFEHTYGFLKRSEQDIDKYVTSLLTKPHILKLQPQALAALRQRWVRTISVFNENLSYAAYSVILLRKRRDLEEEEFFLSEEISEIPAQ